MRLWIFRRHLNNFATLYLLRASGRKFQMIKSCIYQYHRRHQHFRGEGWAARKFVFRLTFRWFKNITTVFVEVVKRFGIQEKKKSGMRFEFWYQCLVISFSQLLLILLEQYRMGKCLAYTFPSPPSVSTVDVWSSFVNVQRRTVISELLLVVYKIKILAQAVHI